VSTIGLCLFAILLVTRLPLISRDSPIQFKEVMTASLIQLSLVFLLLEGWKPLAALAAMIIITNTVWFLWERPSRDSRPCVADGPIQPKVKLLRVRLWILLAALVLLTILASPAFSPSFRAWDWVLRQAQPWCSPLGLLEHVPWHTTLTLAFGLLLCMGEANLVIRGFIEHLDLGPKESEAPECQRGRIIGILERVIIFLLVLNAQYSALGFVLAAKTLARSKNFEQRDFAEYFLVGTLLSVAIAGTLALAVHRAICP